MEEWVFHFHMDVYDFKLIMQNGFMIIFQEEQK